MTESCKVRAYQKGANHADPSPDADVGELLQDPAGVAAAGYCPDLERLSADDGRDAQARFPQAQSQRPRAAARNGRRPDSRRVGGDPVSPHRRHTSSAYGQMGPGPDAAMDVLRTVQPRAVHRGGPFPRRLRAAGASGGTSRAITRSD